MPFLLVSTSLTRLLHVLLSNDKVKQRCIYSKIQIPSISLFRSMDKLSGSTKFAYEMYQSADLVQVNYCAVKIKLQRKKMAVYKASRVKHHILSNNIHFSNTVFQPRHEKPTK